MEIKIKEGYSTLDKLMQETTVAELVEIMQRSANETLENRDLIKYTDIQVGIKMLKLILINDYKEKEEARKQAQEAEKAKNEAKRAKPKRSDGLDHAGQILQKFPAGEQEAFDDLVEKYNNYADTTGMHNFAGKFFTMIEYQIVYIYLNYEIKLEKPLRELLVKHPWDNRLKTHLDNIE